MRPAIGAVMQTPIAWGNVVRPDASGLRPRSACKSSGSRKSVPNCAPKAKNCICIYLEGAPSQLDLWDPKPKLNELHGQKLPESLTKNVRFAFIQKEGARILGSPRTFSRYGECGMELSDLLPQIGSCAEPR